MPTSDVAARAPELRFRHPGMTLALPVAPEDTLAAWNDVRRRMARTLAEPFSRDEWAYLIHFAGEHGLGAVADQALGPRAPEDGAPPRDAVLLRPRGPVALWLPNNVSLLGPLTLMVLSLVGAPVTIKIGSRADDLTSVFVQWLTETVTDGPLADWVREAVTLHAMDRSDPRNAEMSGEAAVRIAFGSDEAVQAIAALPHRPATQTFLFGDHRSEAWAERDRLDEDVLRTLVRIFAIFGQAGCTSPRRLVLLDGSEADAEAVADALVRLWPEVVPAQAPMHIASANLAGHQRALASGWSSRLVDGHRGVVGHGRPELEVVESIGSLFVTAAGLDEAIATAPRQLQTIGHAVAAPLDARWAAALTRTPAKRWVPLAEMHHFGPIWDGMPFWRGLFEEVVMTG